MKMFFLLLVIVFTFGCTKSGNNDDGGGGGGAPINPVLQPDSTYLRHFIGYDISGVTVVYTEDYSYDENLRLKSIIFWYKYQDQTNPAVAQGRDTIIFSYTGSSLNPSAFVSRRARFDNANNLLNSAVFRRLIVYTPEGKVAHDSTISTYSYPPYNFTTSRRFVYESSSFIREYRRTGSSPNESELINSFVYLPGNKLDQFGNGTKVIEAVLDDKKHPYRKLRPLPGFFDVNYPYVSELFLCIATTNNLLDLKIYSLNSGVLLFSGANSFTYRTDGYPLTVNRTYGVGITGLYVSGKFIYY